MSRSQVIMGYHAVSEALTSGKPIKKVYIQSNLKNDNIGKLCHQMNVLNIFWQKVPVEKMNRLSSADHQGVIAMISAVEYEELDMIIPGLYENKQIPLITLLDGVTDVRNFGAIARSVEYFGIDALVTPYSNSADINPFAIKASTGALLNIRLSRVKSSYDATRYLKDCGLQVIAGSEKGKQLISDVDFTVPTLIIFGSEYKGISKDLLKLSDQVVKIPGTGKMESLNVSVAAALFFYEAYRQRKL